MVTITSCERSPFGYRYERGSLPEQPVNLTEFNTEYDDYNSTAPTLGELIPFCFSTNRQSRGNAFNIIYEPMNVNFDKTTGELKITNEYANWMVFSEDYEIINQGLQKIRTTANEFGPNLVVDNTPDGFNFTLLYSTDVTGNAQINFISNQTEPRFTEPKEVIFLNSEYEDMYPTFNADRSRIYFCSDREDNNFDFYYVNTDPTQDIEVMLADNADYQIVKDTNLSSSQDDKCPFIYENRIVFASNREGGFGGYDLYYSLLENGEWSEPINFGETINTASDEFRPILLEEGVTWTQTMMVFSSNRDGGLGGFDLYFVGIFP
ncbi:MAG: hypothetical protein AAF992_07700 [Bacteroidota bacterium]